MITLDLWHIPSFKMFIFPNKIHNKHKSQYVKVNLGIYTHYSSFPLSPHLLKRSAHQLSLPCILLHTNLYGCSASAHLITLALSNLVWCNHVNALWSVSNMKSVQYTYCVNLPIAHTMVRYSFSTMAYLISLSFSFRLTYITGLTKSSNISL